MQFDVRGFRSGDGVVRLVVEADDLATATQRARAQGLAVLSATPQRGLGGLPGIPGIRLRRAPRFPLLQFTHELMALLQAGLDITPVITHRFPAERFEDAFAAVRTGNTGKVLLDWNGA